MTAVPRLLRDALRFAVEVAREGELADPPVPSPPAIRRFLTFRKFSASSNRAIARVLEDDETFRARVAAQADEDEIGRAGWLWLTRPEGWEDEFPRVLEAGPDDPEDRAALLNRLRRERSGAEAAAERVRGELEAVSESRDRLSERLGQLEERHREELVRIADLTAERDALRDERNAVVRDLKRIEAESAELRRDLRTVREALREAETELSEVRHRTSSVERTPGSVESTGSSRIDRDRLGELVAGAAAAADELVEFLADAGRVLSTTVDGRAAARSEEESFGPGGGTALGKAAGPDRADGRRRRSAGRRRPAPELPFGVVEPSDRATEAFLADPANLVIVDGYNLARSIWSDGMPEEERRWVVALLEEAQNRGGAEIHVIFDGRDDTVSPMSSRTVRVGYSPTGITADEMILDLLADVPPVRPVIVVTSDREIADGARSDGAAVVGSEDFARVVRG